MEIDGGTASAIGTGLTIVIGGLAKFFSDDRKDIIGQLKDCTKQHAADQFRLGSFEAALSFLSSTHGAEVQGTVDRMIAAGNQKAEEVKSAAEPTKAAR